ncbi:class I SAM-dependent methyltransferase [Pelagibacteraceae bacterium]|nr:class I SAM-dependent methyltransferase [Pelagibacteraceae bacterium]
MLKKKDLDYFNYGQIENEKFWRRLGERPNLDNKSILDFGCGHGSLCIDLVNNGAGFVTGIDLEDDLLTFANENLNNNFYQLKSKIEFKKKNLLDDKFNQEFDLIVTKDTFEHTIDLPKILDKFYDLLKMNGKVYIGFGPLYNFYNGDHGRTQLKFPWLHVILSDEFIVNRLNKRNKIQINKIEDLGLSKYSFKEYKDMFKNSKFEIEYFATNKSDHPVSKLFNFLSKFRFFREYCTYNIYCVLKKN